jgi:hypothetical protein
MFKMTPELERAVKRYRQWFGRQWFGSYKKSGELVKVQVWLIVNNGSIEFLTLDDSYKVKRIRRNPRVICYIGEKERPSVSGTAEIFMGKHRAGVRGHPLAARSSRHRSSRGEEFLFLLPSYQLVSV